MNELKGLNVFVVEDDADTRDLLKVIIQTEGGDVTALASVPEALAVYAQGRFHVIVADIGMPDYNGYTLIGRIRAHDKTTPAIALTAYTTAIDRDTVLSAGFQVHMPKPFEANELVSVIRDLASGAKPSI